MSISIYRFRATAVTRTLSARADLESPTGCQTLPFGAPTAFVSDNLIVLAEGQ